MKNLPSKELKSARQTCLVSVLLYSISLKLIYQSIIVSLYSSGINRLPCNQDYKHNWYRLAAVFKIQVSCAHSPTPARSGLAPRYLSEYIQSVADSNRRRLRSSSSSQLVIRRTRLSTVGNRAFPVAGSRLWNSLPPDVTSDPTLTVFRNLLETHLFSRSFHS